MYWNSRKLSHVLRRAMITGLIVDLIPMQPMQPWDVAIECASWTETILSPPANISNTKAAHPSPGHPNLAGCESGRIQTSRAPGLEAFGRWQAHTLGRCAHTTGPTYRRVENGLILSMPHECP